MKRSDEKEMMDLPGNPRDLLKGDLRNLQIINRWLGNYRCIKVGLNYFLREQNLRRISLLDVGTGGGDVPAMLVRWLTRRKVRSALVALEPEAFSAALAVAHAGSFPEIAVVRADGALPPFRANSFDFVLASQVLHHFPAEMIVSLLREWSKLARRAIIISDLVRHPIAYHGIRWTTRLLTRNAMTRNDAPLSVRRAFTMAEWRDLLRRAGIGKIRTFRVFPFRVLALVSLGERA
jgi:SAM-dependent methyltransferase